MRKEPSNRLRAIRTETIDPPIAQYRGRVIKTTGDGLLVEFSSVVDALRCATEWQRGMDERNAATADADRLEGPSPEAYACPPVCRRTQRVSLTLRSKTLESRASRTLLAWCGFTEYGSLPLRTHPKWKQPTVGQHSPCLR